MKNPSLLESYYVSCFLSGLHEKIRLMVKMHNPITLAEAFKIARPLENANEAYAKRYRSQAKNVMTIPTISKKSQEE